MVAALALADVAERLDELLDRAARAVDPLGDVGVGMPSIPPIWPIATWMPTPVRNPISTLRERKSAMKPSFTIRATIRMTPVMIASHPGERHVLRRRDRGQARESGGHDRRGGRVGTDHEVTRRPEEREHRDRDAGSCTAP